MVCNLWRNKQHLYLIILHKIKQLSKAYCIITKLVLIKNEKKISVKYCLGQ